MNTERFEVRIGSVLEWLLIVKAVAMVPTIQKPNHWKSEQNGGLFVWISNGFEQNGHHFAQNRTPLENQMPLENQTEGYHWNSKWVRFSSPRCTLLAGLM